MNSSLRKGKLKRWNDAKGFGFIAPSDGSGDIFLHISAFKRIGRRPVAGDVIVYQVHTDNDGRHRAVNARIEGAGEDGPRRIPRSARTPGKPTRATRSNLPTAIALALAVAAGSFAYNRLATDDEIHESPAPPREGVKKSYTCKGKIYCSEMTSCDEAMFYQRNCPGTKMDGNGDGIPCERQWCRW
jgi:cold shock CspA family protein